MRKERVRNSSKSGGSIGRSLNTVKKIKTRVNRTITVVSDNLGRLRGKTFVELDSAMEENIRMVAKANKHSRRNRDHIQGRECYQKHNLLGVMQYTARSIA